MTASAPHPPSPRKHRPHKKLTGQHLRTLRNISDMLAVWTLCPQRSCRKLGKCRGTTEACLDECVEFVPGPARDFLFGIYAGKAEGLDFDTAFARVPEELCEQWCNWHHAIERITGRPSMQPVKKRAPRPAHDGA